MRILLQLNIFISALILSGENFTIPKTYSTIDSNLEILNLPYLKTIPLGDDLFFEGLKIKDEEKEVPIGDLIFQGYDSHNLGDQKITIMYGNKYTSYDIYVTNEFVQEYIPAGGVFISEISYQGYDKLAIEIYNNSEEIVSLSDYSIHCKDDKENNFVIQLNDVKLNYNGIYVISNFELKDVNYQNYGVNLHNISKVSFFKHDEVIDNISFGNLESHSKTMRRHYKSYKGSSVYNEREWFATGDDLSNIGKHVVSFSVVTHKEQAIAYARYVLFGAGMFAAGRVNETFQALKKEYEFMGSAAKDYFNNNKNTKVEGYNENGKFVSMTIEEAQKRIELIASRSGNNSFLPKKKIIFISDIKAVFIVIAGLFLSIVIYLFFNYFKRAANKNI